MVKVGDSSLWIAGFVMEHEFTILRIRKYPSINWCGKVKINFKIITESTKNLNLRTNFLGEEENDAAIRSLMHVLKSIESLIHIKTIKYN